MSQEYTCTLFWWCWRTTPQRLSDCRCVEVKQVFHPSIQECVSAFLVSLWILQVIPGSRKVFQIKFGISVGADFSSVGEAHKEGRCNCRCTRINADAIQVLQKVHLRYEGRMQRWLRFEDVNGDGWLSDPIGNVTFVVNPRGLIVEAVSVEVIKVNWCAQMNKLLRVQAIASYTCWWHCANILTDAAAEKLQYGEKILQLGDFWPWSHLIETTGTNVRLNLDGMPN